MTTTPLAIHHIPGDAFADAGVFGESQGLQSGWYVALVKGFVKSFTGPKGTQVTASNGGFFVQLEELNTGEIIYENVSTPFNDDGTPMQFPETEEGKRKKSGRAASLNSLVRACSPEKAGEGYTKEWVKQYGFYPAYLLGQVESGKAHYVGFKYERPERYGQGVRDKVTLTAPATAAAKIAAGEKVENLPVGRNQGGAAGGTQTGAPAMPPSPDAMPTPPTMPGAPVAAPTASAMPAAPAAPAGGMPPMPPMP